MLSIAIVLTPDSPKCWATSKTNLFPELSHSNAVNISGNCPSNWTSTTAPITWITLPLFFSGCQSRAISRITGSALELQLPEDFDRPISFNSGRKGEKDLFYWSMDGQMKVKTYTDWGLLESEIVFVDKK